MTAPVAKKVPHVHTEHGVERPDPWHWIKDREDPDLIPHLEAENAYVEACLGHRDALRQRLYKEMLGRIQEDDSSVPVRIGEWWYYTRTVEGAAYAIHARKRGGLDAEERVVLDENALADGHDYFKLYQHEISRDHSRVAWLQDTDGAERLTLFVRDLETGETREVATGLKWSIAWGADGRSLFATKGDHAQRPHQIWRYDALGEREPELLLEEPDERFFVGVERTRDWTFVMLESGSKTTTEVHLLDGADPQARPRIVWPRVEGVLYDVSHHSGSLIVRTNGAADGGRAINFRVVSVPADDPSGPQTELLPHDPDIHRTGLQAFRDHLVVWERRDALPGVRIRELATGRDHLVRFPEPAYALSPERNPSFDTHELRWTYQSMRTPPTVEVFDMQDHERAILKIHPVIGHDPKRYVVRRVEAIAKDGASIPISLMHRADLDLEAGPHPTYLTGYGSYGYAYPSSFSSVRFSLADRGFILAIAHIRGGAERGRGWYEDGKLAHKMNTFTDFVSAAAHLFSLGWTAPDRLAIQGGSAGGLLMGAVCNLAPDHFRAVVADVPFVDALNTMLDADLPLTVTEYDEWGNPNEREVFDRMRDYAPYENVGAFAYPHIYATAGLNDPRVGYWEPAKWVQKLRAKTTSDRPILLKTHLGAGHGGQSGRYGRLEDQAWAYTFVLDRLGKAD